MKKLSILIFAVIASISILTGCSNGSKKAPSPEFHENYKIIAKVNKEFNHENMLTINGDNFSISKDENAFADQNLGFGLTMPASFGNISNRKNLNAYIGEDNSLTVDYIPEVDAQTLASLDNTDNSKKLVDETIANSFHLFKIARLNLSLPESKEILASIKTIYSSVEEIATLGNDTYYFACNKSAKLPKLTATDKADIKLLIADIPSIKNSICIFPSLQNDGDLTSNSDIKQINLHKFTATTINGNEITQDVLSGYDVTMVNIWSTSNASLLGELSKVSENLPENVNMISICTDADNNIELVKAICEENSVKFNILVGSNELNALIIDHIDSFPATLLFDKNGKLLGSPIFNVTGENPSEEYLNIINSTLQTIEK